MSTKERVCIVGSGNWGSGIAKIIGRNVRGSEIFEEDVKMWVFEELVDGRKLTDIINTEHENVRYLPGIKIPENVYAEADLLKAVEGATILVFVVPHQFVRGICEKLRGNIRPDAKAISLIKVSTQRLDTACRTRESRDQSMLHG
jgi:glycerol-3-phosphate dehydrogenase (NAD+)